MVSENMELGPPQRTENGIGSRMVLEDESIKFARAVKGISENIGSTVQKPRSVAAPRFVFDNNKMYPIDHDFDRDDRCFRGQDETAQRCTFGSSSRVGQEQLAGCQQWNAEGSNGSTSGDNSGDEEGGDEEEDEEDDDIDDGDGEVDGLVSTDNGVVKNHNNSSGSVQSSSDKICDGRVNSKEHYSSFGSSKGGLLKDMNDDPCSMNKQQYQHCRPGQYDSAIYIPEPEMYYARILQGEDISTLSQKETGGRNECRTNGRKVISTPIDPVESLKMHLSDPITGFLMDDAMILSCGHSYGSAGMQHITRMRACFKCGHPASGDSVRPNLALQSAVQAFRREEDSQLLKMSKRRRDKFEQDKFTCDDSLHTNVSRGKGVQFPFVVSDRVIIKGNKRTPQRFVGRVAVVTTQCLNGWYVVKTLDNAESVKLQYRSLAKVPDDMLSGRGSITVDSSTIPSKAPPLTTLG